MVTPPHTPQRETSHTMTALTTEEFITWANRLTGLPWPMTTKEFATIATGEFGWIIFDGKQVFAITLPNYSERVFVGKTSEGEVRKIHFPLARTKTEDRDSRIELNDLFAGYTTVGTETWGSPIKTEHGKKPLMTWSHPTGCILKIVRTQSLVLFTFYTPQGARYYE